MNHVAPVLHRLIGRGDGTGGGKPLASGARRRGDPTEETDLARRPDRCTRHRATVVEAEARPHSLIEQLLWGEGLAEDASGKPMDGYAESQMVQ